MDYCSFDFSEFGELVRVTLYDDAKLEFLIPIQCYRPNVLADTQVPEMTIHENLGEQMELLMRTSEESPLPKVETELTVAGRKSKVSLEFEFIRSHDKESMFETQLVKLRSKWYHALFEFSSGKKCICRATRDSFLFSYSESDGKSFGTITIENTSGLQPLRYLNS